jgi:hypothetical protein
MSRIRGCCRFTGLTTVTDLSVSRNLYVSGVSTFVGNVTFQGKTHYGDSNTG